MGSMPRPSRGSPENKADLIVTVDCGISAVSEAELARAGHRADHHRPPHDRLGVAAGRRDRAPAFAGWPRSGADLCGAAVAFKLAWQVCKSFGDGKRASPQLREFLKRALGLVALATIADMVPLSDENRVMVRHGLAGIAAGAECRAQGLDGSERRRWTRKSSRPG